MNATYLYCVVQAPSAPRLRGGSRGLPHTGRPRLLALDPGTWLVVTDAPGEHYGADVLEQGLTDIEWVARCALGHERVVASFLGSATTLPFRLFTLFRDDDRAVARMRRRRADIRRLLSRVAHSQEWGLRVHIDRAPGLPVAPAGAPDTAPGARDRRSGRAFLERKRQAALARRNAWLAAADCARTVYAELGPLAAEARRRDHPGAIAGSVLLDAAFLVPRARTAAFRSALDGSTSRLRKLGCRVVATGPWPPYSFTDPMRSMPCDEKTKAMK